MIFGQEESLWRKGIPARGKLLSVLIEFRADFIHKLISRLIYSAGLSILSNNFVYSIEICTSLSKRYCQVRNVLNMAFGLNEYVDLVVCDTLMKNK